MRALIEGRSNALVALLGIACAYLASGCAGDPADGEDDGLGEPVGTAQQRQLDSGSKIWRQVTLTFNDPSSTPLATVYVFNVSLGGFATGKEYWYVNESSLSLLGSYGLSVVPTDESTSTAPPDPGYASEQSFNLAENVTWNGPWTSDPLSGGSLYAGPGNLWVRLTRSVTGAGLAKIAWYQALPTGSSASNITPSGTFSVVATGGSVVVPGGDRGFDVSQSVP